MKNIDDGATPVSLRRPPASKQILGLICLNLVLVVLSPLILFKKLSRVLKKGSRHELDWHRWFIPAVQKDVPLAPKPGPSIVIGAPAFGELRLAEAVTKRLAQLRPDANVIWSIGDLATIEFAKKEHPEQAIVIAPYENIYPATKWSRMARPDVIVLVEKFWLANLLAVSQLRGTRIAVINTRSNKKESGLLSGYFRWMVQNVDLFCFLSGEGEERLGALLSARTRVCVTGNMKLDLETKALGDETKRSLEEWLAPSEGVPLLAAGSTGSAVDEAFVLDALVEVRNSASANLLLAPRRLARVAEVAMACETRGLKVSRRSSSSGEKADVYLLDTLGELAYTYQFARGAFVGDTVVGSGHNVIEPLVWGVPVCYAMSRGHFGDLQVLAESFGVGFRCSSPGDLATHWVRILTDDEFAGEVRVKAKRMIEGERGATEKTVAALLDLIG